MAVEKVFANVNEMKEGKYIIVDDAPCKIVGIQKSKPGKHGAAKFVIEAMGILDGKKRNLMKTSGSDVEVPILERKRGQVVSVSGNSVQVMDTESYETFDLAIPEDYTDAIKEGEEIPYIQVMGVKMISKK